MSTYINDTSQSKVITIPIKYDGNGTPTEYKNHTLEPNEAITFDQTEDNGTTIINECVDNSLSAI